MTGLLFEPAKSCLRDVFFIHCQRALQAPVASVECFANTFTAGKTLIQRLADGARGCELMMHVASQPNYLSSSGPFRQVPTRVVNTSSDFWEDLGIRVPSVVC